jgi:hypothetical protein
LVGVDRDYLGTERSGTAATEPLLRFDAGFVLAVGGETGVHGGAHGVQSPVEDRLKPSGRPSSA